MSNHGSITAGLLILALQGIVRERSRTPVPPASSLKEVLRRSASLRKEKLARANYKQPPVKLERNAEIVRMKQAGMSHRKIAAAHGITATRVAQIVADAKD